MFIERMLLIGALAVLVVAGGRHMVKQVQDRGNTINNVFTVALSR